MLSAASSQTAASREAQQEAAQASSARFQGRVERAPLEVTLPLKEVTN